MFSLLSFNTITVNAATTEGCYKYSVSNGKAVIQEYDKFNGISGELIIPSSLGGYPVTEISSSAFHNNNNLTCVIIPGSVKKIGDYAFSECHNLETLVLKEGVEEIGEEAFKRCDLISVTIPRSLSRIKSSAFLSNKIEEVYITDLKAWCEITFQNYASSPFYFNGNDYSNTSPGYIKTSKLYLNNKLITELMIPEGVTKISYSAFHGCTSITKVVIPTSVIQIDKDAFRACTAITDIWYAGSQSESNNIKINDNNSHLIEATWHYNSCLVGAPHSYNNDCDDTCNDCGKKRTVSGHSYDNTCDTTCNICNGIRTVSHTYDNSCDTQCNICNSSRTISHSYGEWEVTKKASCTESGTKVRKCGVCSKTESDTTSSLGHNFSTEWTIDAKVTCTTAGSKSNHCTRCSATSNDTTISARGHSWGEWVTEKKATDKSEGLSTRKCGECGLKETQTIAKLAADGHTHKFGEWQIIKAATCKEKGKAIRTCSICKEQEQKDLLATGHQVGEWVEVSATCTSDGTRERTCVICKETEKITIKALGHDFEKTVVIKEPTDNEKGIKQSNCKRCGGEIAEEIPALLSDSNNASNTDSEKITDGVIENKSTNNSWIIWTIIGVLVLIVIGLGMYLILKKTHLNSQR